MKHPLALTATALIALTSITLAPAFAQTASGAATGQNGAQYGDPNNSMAEGSQTTNGALSGQNPGSTSPGDITSGSDETHSYSGADLNQNNNGAFSPLSNGELNGAANLSSNPPGTR
jgi:hypothetical protein